MQNAKCPIVLISTGEMNWGRQKRGVGSEHLWEFDQCSSTIIKLLGVRFNVNPCTGEQDNNVRMNGYSRDDLHAIFHVTHQLSF